MASKVIHTILNLRDNMSGGLIKAAKNTKGVSKEMVSATRSVVAFKNKSVSALGKVMKKTVKWGAVTAGAVAALAAKTSLSEAMDLEGYRLQLETATKDTKKAAGIMKYAIDLANKTPFEGGELVAASSALEMFGLKTQRWLPVLGDAAAATNKDMQDVQQGFIKALTTGEFEGLKDTLSITKDMVDDFSKKTFGKSFVNAKGQITDINLLQDALEGLMNDRFKGGMEKQGSTLKGLWSTVTGVTKSALASIVGITTDGSIKSGSVMELLKGKISLLAKKMEQWQQDGTIDRISDQFTRGLGKVMDTAGAAFQWVKEHGDGIKRTLVAVGSAFAMVKTVKFVSGVVTAIKTFKLFATTVGAFVAANPIVWGIGAAIAIGSLLIANWDRIKAYGLSVWESAKEGFASWKQEWEAVKERGAMMLETAKGIFGGIKDSIVGAFDAAKEKVGGFFSWVGDKLSALDGKIENTPLIGTLYKGVKSAGGWIADRISGHATGTSFFPGGLTRVHERGGEILNLPGGTQIIPHDVSRRMTGGLTIMVPVTVQGNIIGNQAYADQLGNTVVQRVLRALRNV